MVHLWGFHADFADVVNRTGCPRPPWARSHRDRWSSRGSIGLHSLTRKQRGRGPGSVLRVLPRHIRLQDAYSIDLTDSIKELDQDFLNLLPLRPGLVSPHNGPTKPHHNTKRRSVKTFAQWYRVDARPPGGRQGRAPRRRVRAPGCPPASCRRAGRPGTAAARSRPAVPGAAL